MFLPNKFISTEQALLTLGGQTLRLIDSPLSVSDAWMAVKAWRSSHRVGSPVPFWWFALALDSLFALGAVELVDDQLRRVAPRAADADE